MAKIKSSKMVEMAKHVESRATMYWNNFSYYGHAGGNCGLVHDDGVQSFDCNNFVKSLINKPDIAYSTKVWDYAVPGTVIPDVTEYGLLSLCTDIRWGDFSNVAPAEVLYMAGHIGLFVGTYQDPSGEVNTIEATAAMGGGVLSSWCSPTGLRYDHKGGNFLGRWEAHGKLTPYIDYGSEPKPQPVIKKGVFDYGTIWLAQSVLRKDYSYVEVDGYIDGQEANLIATYVPAADTKYWRMSGTGSLMVMAIQNVLRKNGLYSGQIDGIWGYKTSLGLQKFLNKFGYGLDEDGQFGYNSTCAYQDFLQSIQ